MSDVIWVGVAQVVVAAAGVLVATVVSVRLARGEREARGKGAREESDRLAEEKRAAAAGELLAAVSMLSQAAFEREGGEEARLRVGSGRHLALGAVHLTAVDDPFLRWVGVELEEISEGLNDRDLFSRVPLQAEQIQWKCGHLIDFIMAWLKRERPVDFFRDLPHVPLSQTARARGFKEQQPKSD